MILSKIINRLRIYQNSIYSALISTFFKTSGNNFQIEYPCRVVGGECISIGNNFQSFGRLRIEAHTNHNDTAFTPVITIGDNVSINFDCHIGCINKIQIGNGVLIASNVFMTDHFHGDVSIQSISLPPSKRIVQSKGPIIIEDNVWIGEGVAIMPNVRIGRNCIVGANAVVTKSFPANSVIGGVPAKLIKIIE